MSLLNGKGTKAQFLPQEFKFKSEEHARKIIERNTREMAKIEASCQDWGGNEIYYLIRLMGEVENGRTTMDYFKGKVQRFLDKMKPYAHHYAYMMRVNDCAIRYLSSIGARL